MKTVLIPKSLVEQLIVDRARYLPNETGGYLLGQRWEGEIEIVSATTQGPDDKATPTSFDRYDDSHHLIALERWQQDGGRTGFAGDWHSHPSGDGEPSLKDRRAWSILQGHSQGPVAGFILAETKALRVFRCAKVLGIMRVTECLQLREDDTHLYFAPRGSEASDKPRYIKI